MLPRKAHHQGFKQPRSPLQRKPLERRSDKAARIRRRRAGLNKVGKKGRANAKANRQREPKFIQAGITYCEVNYPGCTNAYNVTWAHGRKRRKLLTGELEDFVCVSCTSCHRILDEVLTHDEMAAKVAEIIEKRETRIAA